VKKVRDGISVMHAYFWIVGRRKEPRRDGASYVIKLIINEGFSCNRRYVRWPNLWQAIVVCGDLP